MVKNLNAKYLINEIAWKQMNGNKSKIMASHTFLQIEYQLEVPVINLFVNIQSKFVQ